jgi:2-amino-4-hydroxy-6-hydroxymethyldihydropteridine diphosphokinase
MTIAYVGIGSNIEKHLHIERAIRAMVDIDAAARISTIYESPAYGFNGHRFFNLVVELTTSQSLLSFAHSLRELEFQLGRKQDAQKKQNRTIDLDIILFGESVCDQEVKVPRQDIYHYPFVIQPLYELNPDLIIPGDGRSIKEIWEKSPQIESLTAIEPWFTIS